jgi:hypothetical protein
MERESGTAPFALSAGFPAGAKRAKSSLMKRLCDIVPKLDIHSRSFLMHQFVNGSSMFGS